MSTLFFRKMPKHSHIPKVLRALKNAAFAALVRRRPFRNGRRRPPLFWPFLPLFLAAFSFARNSRKTPQPEKPRRRPKFRRQKWKRFLRNIGYPAFKTERKRQAFGTPLPGEKSEIAQKLRIHVFLRPPIFPFPSRRKIGAENERRSRRRNPLPLPLRCRRFQISAPPI